MCSSSVLFNLPARRIYPFVYVSFFFFKQKTAYEMRISDWSSDVCSSDLARRGRGRGAGTAALAAAPGHQRVVDPYVGRLPEAALHQVIGQADRRLDIEAARLQQRRQFLRGREFRPVVGTARHPAQQVLGGDDRGGPGPAGAEPKSPRLNSSH